MKKTLTLTTLALLAGGVSAFAQGSVSMADFGGIGIQVFAGQANGGTTVTWGGYTGTELMGNSGDTSSYNYSAGSHVTYTGAALGAGYTVELLAGPTTATTVAQLTETGALISTWYTGSSSTALGGFWNGAINGIVPSVASGGNASVAIAAWYNNGGTVTTLAAAQLAGDAWGVSNVGLATKLGGGLNQPPSPTGLESFSLVSTPEPSTIALGVIGASTLLFRRRK